MAEAVDWNYFAYTWNRSASVREVAEKLGVNERTVRWRRWYYASRRRENPNLPELVQYSRGRPPNEFFSRKP